MFYLSKKTYICNLQWFFDRTIKSNGWLSPYLHRLSPSFLTLLDKSAWSVPRCGPYLGWWPKLAHYDFVPRLPSCGVKCMRSVCSRTPISLIICRVSGCEYWVQPDIAHMLRWRQVSSKSGIHKANLCLHIGQLFAGYSAQFAHSIVAPFFGERNKSFHFVSWSSWGRQYPRMPFHECSS